MNNTIASLQNRVKSTETTNESLQQLIMHLKAHRCDDVIVAANVDKNKLLEIKEAINDEVGGQRDQHNRDPTKNNPYKIKPTKSFNYALLKRPILKPAEKIVNNRDDKRLGNLPFTVGKKDSKFGHVQITFCR